MCCDDARASPLLRDILRDGFIRDSAIRKCFVAKKLVQGVVVASVLFK